MTKDRRPTGEIDPLARRPSFAVRASEVARRRAEVDRTGAFVSDYFEAMAAAAAGRPIDGDLDRLRQRLAEEADEVPGQVAGRDGTNGES